MAQIKVTVNGRPVDVWIDEEETQEIGQFYRAELCGLRKTCRQPILSKHSIKNVTKPMQASNNSVRFA